MILIARWGYYVEPLPGGSVHDSMIKDAESQEHTPEDSALVLERGLQRTITELEEAGARVWIMKQVPLQVDDPIRKQVQACQRGEETPHGISLAEHHQRQKNANSVLEDFASAGRTVFDPATVCFDDQGRSMIGTKGRSYYFDDDHLSPFGSRTLLGPLLAPAFEVMAREQQLAERASAAENDLR